MSEIPQDRPDDRWEPATQPPPADAAEQSRPREQDQPVEQTPAYAGTPPGQSSSQDQHAPQDPYATGRQEAAAWSGESYGAPYTGGGAQRHAPAGGAPTPTSAVLLLILSGLGLLVFVWVGVGIVWAAPVVLAIIALVQRADVALSKRLLKIGWIVYAVLAVLTVVLISLAVAAFVIFAGRGASSGPGAYDPGTIALTIGWLGAR